MAIDPKVLIDLMKGFYTCWWCGATRDKDTIADHVDGCLRQKRLWEQQLAGHGTD
jgi:hypothetical protein